MEESLEKNYLCLANANVFSWNAKRVLELKFLFLLVNT